MYREREDGQRREIGKRKEGDGKETNGGLTTERLKKKRRKAGEDRRVCNQKRDGGNRFNLMLPLSRVCVCVCADRFGIASVGRPATKKHTQ